MTTSQGVTLHPALKCVLGKHLNDSTAVLSRLTSACTRESAVKAYLWVPLEVSVGDLKSSVKLVRGDLIWRENTEGVHVEFDNFGDVLSNAGISSERCKDILLTPSCWTSLCLAR